MYSMCSFSCEALTMLSDTFIQLWGTSSRLYQVGEIGQSKLQLRSLTLAVQHWNLASRGEGKLGLTTGKTFFGTKYSGSHVTGLSKLYSKLRQIKLQDSRIVDDDCKCRQRRSMNSEQRDFQESFPVDGGDGSSDEELSRRLDSEAPSVASSEKDAAVIEDGISRMSGMIFSSKPTQVSSSCAQDVELLPDNFAAEASDSHGKISGKEKRACVVKQLKMGQSPQEILEGKTEWSPPEFWAVVEYFNAHGLMFEALEVFEWWKSREGYRARELHYTKFMRMLGSAHMPKEAQKLFDEMCGIGIWPSVATYTCLLQCYAECGYFQRAEEILKEMVLSGDAKPNTVTYTGLLHAYGKKGLYDEMWRIFNTMKTVGIPPDDFTYRTLVKAYAEGGLFSRMQKIIREMVGKDIHPDSPTLNSIVKAYAEVGSVKEMEKHYRILREYRFNARQPAIKAIVLRYARENLYFQLGEFVRLVGIRRPSVGNYLWNSLLLSYAANFQMSHVEEEFKNMKVSGFLPDLTTYNILCLAYARMEQFWDLRVTILTMQSEGVAPDLVTYGAVVDGFIYGRLQTKLTEALVEMRNIDLVAEVYTDPLVFEIFGRGNLHVACESLARNMQGVDFETCTYANLIGYYLQTLDRRKSEVQRN